MDYQVDSCGFVLPDYWFSMFSLKWVLKFEAHYTRQKHTESDRLVVSKGLGSS